MKLTNVRFFAKNNIRGNEKSKTVVALMCVFALSVTIISSFSVTVTNALNLHKSDFRSHSLELYPSDRLITDSVVKSVENIDHVKGVYPLMGTREVSFTVLNIEDESGTNNEIMLNADGREVYIEAHSLIGDEKRPVISGKTLDESPTFSCIVPDLFYPYDDHYNEQTGEKHDLEYIDGESLIGKTITVVPFGGDYECTYNYEGVDEGLGGSDIANLPALEYKLKVVGVYYDAPTQFGNYDTVFYSEETGRQIEKMALEASDIDLSSETSRVANWWKNKSLRIHYVEVDDFENIPEVQNELGELGFFLPDSMFVIPESVANMANILSLPCYILIFAIAVICIINIIQSTTSTLNKRKSEIGLLKAVGFKDRQILLCLCYEQLSLAIKGFVIGGGLSAVFIAIANFINYHRTFNDRLYIVSWGDYFIFLLIAFAVAVIVPLLCQLITIHKLSKIQPKDVMN